MTFMQHAVFLLLLIVWVGRTTPFSPSSKVHYSIYNSNKVPYQSQSPSQSPSFERNGPVFQNGARISRQKGKLSTRSSSSSSSLLGLFPASASAIIANSGLVPVARTTAILGAVVAFLLNWKRILWPNASPDPHYANAPLPPGSFGCPFVGQLFFVGSKEHGVNHYWYKMLKTMKGAGIWKSYFLGNPMAVVTGGKRIASLLNQEFQPNGVQSVQLQSSLVGRTNILRLTNGKEHSFMRKLVGSAMTPAACNAAVPNLQALSEKQADKMIQQGHNVTIREACSEFTLDVAWRQILGLNLKDDEEIHYFYKMVDIWVTGFSDIRNRFNLGLKHTKGYKAGQYITSKIEERIDSLLQNGPDETTISGMVFATDDDGSSKKLSRQQVIDNSLLLTLAGSETSASTLTNVMLFLGLNRDAWDKLVEEQRIVQAKHGDKLQRDILEKECPYLEGVIKEAMRIRPVPTAMPRRVKETKIVDGFQIPKGWIFLWNIVLTHIHDPITYKEDLSHMDPIKGFQPERWMDKKTRPSDDFIPMGAGPRYCLGSTLAYTEMKVFLAVLARNIDFTLLKDPEEALLLKKVSIIPLPADGVVVNVWASNLSPSPTDSEFSQNDVPSLKKGTKF